MPFAVVDDSNWQNEIIVGQKEGFGFGLVPQPASYNSRLHSKPFGAEIPTIPRSDWSAMIKERKERKMNISDHQNWSCDNQGSFPTCWAAGTVQAYSTLRVMRLGIKNHVRISAMSIAVPISGGRSGGWEADAVRYLTQHGGVDSRLWGYTDPSRKDNNPEVQANRLLYKSFESYDCDNIFDNFATALLLGWPCTVSYNWWSHVVMLCDLVEIEANSFGLLIRNNWGDSYGDRHPVHGYGGYKVFREGRGTPSGGFAFRDVSLTFATAA